MAIQELDLLFIMTSETKSSLLCMGPLSIKSTLQRTINFVLFYTFTVVVCVMIVSLVDLII